LDQSELLVFGSLMKKEFDSVRLRFCKEYQVLMMVWEDDFYEQFGVKLKCAQSYMRLMDTDEALDKEIVFTNSN